MCVSAGVQRVSKSHMNLQDKQIDLPRAKITMGEKKARSWSWNWIPATSVLIQPTFSN